MAERMSVEEQVLKDFYEGKTVMQLVNEYNSRYECSKQEAIEKIYLILKTKALLY